MIKANETTQSNMSLQKENLRLKSQMIQLQNTINSLQSAKQEMESLLSDTQQLYQDLNVKYLKYIEDNNKINQTNTTLEVYYIYIFVIRCK